MGTVVEESMEVLHMDCPSNQLHVTLLGVGGERSNPTRKFISYSSNNNVSNLDLTPSLM